MTAQRTLVDTARTDKVVAAQEAKDATGDQNAKLREAKIWRRKLVRRANRASRRGAAVPAALLHVGSARSVPSVLEQIAKLTDIAEKNQTALSKAGKGTDVLLADGKKVYSDLQADDDTQETARLAALPEKVRDFYAAKGTLYIGLKVLNDAGHELHADELGAAAKYNLKILHRHAPATASTGDAPNS